MDVESGYGDTPRKVGETIALAIKAGAIGCNLEDSFPENGSLRETKHQVERIRHARQKADETEVSFFINARTDVFIQVSQDEHNASLVAKALERAEAYAGAGADGLFVPGLADLALISDLTKASPLPVNIMVSQGANISALAKRGVEFERYNFMKQDEDGIWSAPGGAKVAWFRDPEGNILSLSYHLA